jgi:iron complex outermembrane recepter protein
MELGNWCSSAGLRCVKSHLGDCIGYTWADKKYEIAAFCRNCTNQIRTTGAIDFENATGFINDPMIVGGQFSVRF